MNIAPIKALIPATFEYVYVDPDGATQTEQIELQLKRMSFDLATSEKFREAVENAKTNPGPVVGIVVGLIGSWNIDFNGEVFPPTAENIGALPPDFVGELAKAIFEVVVPNPQKAETLPNGSVPADESTIAATTSNDDGTLALPASSGE
jgi:hypothetical protein